MSREVKISLSELQKYLTRNYVENGRCKICGRQINGDVIQHFKMYHVKELEEAKLKIAAGRVKPTVARLDSFF